MKHIFLLVFLALSYTYFAQSESIEGNYEIRYDNKEGIIVYSLSLNPDGTFVFHTYDKIYGRLTQEKNQYGKGTWKAEKNLVYFYTDKDTDFDEKHTLDFKNTKARFITKSPRDKSDREIKTAILFYESDSFWIVRWKLFKQ